VHESPGLVNDFDRSRGGLATAKREAGRGANGVRVASEGDRAESGSGAACRTSNKIILTTGLNYMRVVQIIISGRHASPQ